MTTALKERKLHSQNGSGKYADIAQQMVEYLAGTYTLYVKTQNFHWNVTGELFPQLHLLFEKQYQQLAQQVDDIAEQIRVLGFFVPASLLAFEEISRIEDETGGPLNSQKMIQTLADDHEEMVKEGEALVSALEDVDDAATADLVVDTIKQHQKNAWMLKSSLEAHK